MKQGLGNTQSQTKLVNAEIIHFCTERKHLSTLQKLRWLNNYQVTKIYIDKLLLEC